MKVLLSWIREFVDVPGTAEEIGARIGVDEVGLRRAVVEERAHEVPRVDRADPEGALAIEKSDRPLPLSREPYQGAKVEQSRCPRAHMSPDRITVALASPSFGSQAVGQGLDALDVRVAEGLRIETVDTGLPRAEARRRIG